MADTQSYEKNNQALTRYYQLQSKIYDMTRWSFLFGRNQIIDWVIAEDFQPKHIFEIGCGTGKNLVPLAHAYPEASITALDLSEDMLDIAKKKLAFAGDRVTTIREPYKAPIHKDQPYDLILFSYALTMFNPGWEEAIEAAAQDLSPDGLIAVVDFHASPVPLYKSWMLTNHVRMDAHVLPKLQSIFQPRREQVCSAYLGVWQYMLFIGSQRKP